MPYHLNKTPTVKGSFFVAAGMFMTDSKHELKIEKIMRTSLRELRVEALDWLGWRDDAAVRHPSLRHSRCGLHG